MRHLLKYININKIHFLCFSLFIFASCQKDIPILENTQQDNLISLNKKISKPKKAKKILEDNVNGRLLYSHDEIYNFSYDGLLNCSGAAYSKIIFGNETPVNNYSFTYNGNNVTIKSSTTTTTNVTYTYNPTTKYITSTNGTGLEGKNESTTYNYNSIGSVTQISDNKSDGFGRGETEKSIYSNITYDANKNLTGYKITTSKNSIISPSVYVKTYQEIVKITYFPTIMPKSDYALFSSLNNFNGLDFVSLSGLSIGKVGNKMASKITTTEKYFNSNGTIASNNVFITEFKKDASNLMLAAVRRHSTLPNSSFTSDKVYTYIYEY